MNIEWLDHKVVASYSGIHEGEVETYQRPTLLVPLSTQSTCLLLMES